MNNITIKAAAKIAGDPYLEISATRGLSDGVTIPVADTDWSAEALSCFISTAPGQAVLETLPIVVTTEATTWQDYIDCEGVTLDQLPCGVLPTAAVTTSLVDVTWLAADFASIPLPTQLGKPVTMYFEIRRTGGTGGIFILGEFIITERIT